MVTSLRQTAFRLTEADLALLDAARAKLGLINRTEALRFVLRQWADEHGVSVKLTPKRRPKKR